MKLHRAILLLPLLFFISGCIQITQVVRVNPDGSGTVHVTFLLREEFVEMMSGFKAQFDSLSNSFSSELFSEKDIRAEAEKIGQGVEYKSHKKVKRDGFEGYEAEYVFRDIRTVVLSSSTGSGPSGATQSQMDTTVRFGFQPGSPSFLTIRLLDDRDKNKEQDTVETSGEPDSLQTEQFTELIRGMRFTIAVEIMGRIVQTNATYREGNRLTLLDMDFNALIANPELMQKLEQLDAEQIQQARELLKNVEGIKIELNELVEVRMQ